eukprot:4122999-Prymnesium_polylepis.1
MQLLARVPRGPDANERAQQLTDHRIYTVFDGDHPPLVTDKPENSVATQKRTFAEIGREHAAEQERMVVAKRIVTGEASAEPPPSYSGGLNTLRAQVMDYRKGNQGQAHVTRYFEIGAKGEFETSEEMPLLSAEEQALVTQIETGLPPAEAVFAAEAEQLWGDDQAAEQAADAQFRLNCFDYGVDENRKSQDKELVKRSEKLTEKWVNNRPSSANQRFDFFLRFLMQKANEIMLGDDCGPDPNMTIEDA